MNPRSIYLSILALSFSSHALAWRGQESCQATVQGRLFVATAENICKYQDYAACMSLGNHYPGSNQGWLTALETIGQVIPATGPDQTGVLGSILRLTSRAPTTDMLEAFVFCFIPAYNDCTPVDDMNLQEHGPSHHNHARVIGERGESLASFVSRETQAQRAQLQATTYNALVKLTNNFSRINAWTSQPPIPSNYARELTDVEAWLVNRPDVRAGRPSNSSHGDITSRCQPILANAITAANATFPQITAQASRVSTSDLTTAVSRGNSPLTCQNVCSTQQVQNYRTYVRRRQPAEGGALPWEVFSWYGHEVSQEIQSAWQNQPISLTDLSIGGGIALAIVTEGTSIPIQTLGPRVCQLVGQAGLRLSSIGSGLMVRLAGATAGAVTLLGGARPALAHTRLPRSTRVAEMIPIIDPSASHSPQNPSFCVVQESVDTSRHQNTQPQGASDSAQ